MSSLSREWMPPAIDRGARRQCLDERGADAFEREYGVKIRSDVWKLWTSPRHKRFPQKSQQWLDFRDTRLTASVVGTVLGYPTFAGESRRKKFLNYIGLGTPFVGNAACDHGVKYEDCGMAALERIISTEVRQSVFLPFDILDSKTPTITPFAFSPDGIGCDGTVAECKCPFYRNIVPGVVKAAYGDGQVQFGMHVLDGDCAGLYDQTYFFEYKPPTEPVVQWYVDTQSLQATPQADTEIVNIVRISRDPRWAPLHVWLLQEFWSEVDAYRTTPAMPDHYRSEAAATVWYKKRVVAEPHRFPRVQRVLSLGLKRKAEDDAGDAAGDSVDDASATATTAGVGIDWNCSSQAVVRKTPGSDIVW